MASEEQAAVGTSGALVVSKADVRVLRERLKDAGLFERREAEAWLKFALLVGVFAGLLAIQLASPWWAALLLVPLQAAILTPAAMHGHDGAHRAHSTNGWSNDLMMFLAFPLMSGLGAVYWSMKHNRNHHVHTNVIGDDKRDPDIDMFPFATTKWQYDKSGPLRRFFARNLQAAAFWPMTTLMQVQLRVLSWVWMARYIKEKGVDRTVVIDAVMLVAHFGLWLVVPSLIWGPAAAFAYYFGVWTCVSVLLAIIFAPAHMGMPVVKDYGDFYALQLQTCRNLTMPRWLSWFFVGLDYQIEHHLFQNMPAMQLKKAAPIVKAWAGERGYPYYEMPLGEAVIDTTKWLHRAWREERLDLAPGAATAR